MAIKRLVERVRLLFLYMPFVRSKSTSEPIIVQWNLWHLHVLSNFHLICITWCIIMIYKMTGVKWEGIMMIYIYAIYVMLSRNL